MNELAKSRKKRRIVSSEHLATEGTAGLSEYEYGLIIAFQAFSRWVGRCMVAAGEAGLSQLEIMVLHHVNHRDRAKRLSDIGFQLNFEDLHTINYALKKLKLSGLITAERRGKEIYYATSSTGAALCERYREVREECLVSGLNTLDMDNERLSELANLLRALSGFYDQASRSAASL